MLGAAWFYRGRRNIRVDVTNEVCGRAETEHVGTGSTDPRIHTCQV